MLKEPKTEIYKSVIASPVQGCDPAENIITTPAVEHNHVDDILDNPILQNDLRENIIVTPISEPQSTIICEIPSDIQKLEDLYHIKEDTVSGKWTKLPATELKKIGIKSLQDDIREIKGSVTDAFEFFKAQVESYNKNPQGVFIGKDVNGVIFAFREKSKFGPPTIDVNGIKGIRKIKFLE